MRCLKIKVNGVVQGVGFRPFVYRIAKRNNLRGYVKNLGDAGVEILAQGDLESIENLINALKNQAPPLSRVESIKVEEETLREFQDFIIEHSSADRHGGDSVIPPDVAICDECLRELFDPTNRRYMYPFIVCTNCGPRFSIMEKLPYDRENTSMRDFPMCNDCMDEYTNPMDRRYHAEPVCCDQCGPEYTLIDNSGKRISGDPLKMAAHLIDNGYIVAIKGIGGFHIACDAKNENIVEKLRVQLGREQQPFAIMAKDLSTVKSFAYIEEYEKKELQSYRRPITLLRKKKPFPLPESLAPGLHTIGVMLPYAPVHYILFHYSKTPVYVMTSGNHPDFPMVKDNDRIEEIKDVADFFLIHNRKIVNRIDDSVVRFVSEKRAVIRRSRGFVPLPVGKVEKYDGIALGAELMNSFSLIKNGRVYPSQYIGNTSKIEVMEFLKEALARFRSLITLENMDLIMVDSHPLYNTSQFGRELAMDIGIEFLNVQHHKAHLASAMLENEISEMVGIAIDAVGYGSDGNTWGGEIISITPSSIKRLNHISYYPLPGGDLAAHYPLRALIGLLSKIYEPEEIESFIYHHCPESVKHLRYGDKELSMIIHQVEKRVNSPLTSSTGRFLDAIAVLLNIAHNRTYEGEPAMKLESISIGGIDMHIEIPIGRHIDVYRIIPQLQGRRIDIAYSVHTALGRALTKEAVWHADNLGIKNIGVSGGVAYNEIIMTSIGKYVKNAGFRLISTEDIPRGDNGISAGQAYLGGLYLRGDLRRDEIG